MRKADNLITILCRLSWNLGASNSWDPQGLSRSVIRLLYLCICNVVDSELGLFMCFPKRLPIMSLSMLYVFRDTFVSPCTASYVFKIWYLLYRVNFYNKFYSSFAVFTHFPWFCIQFSFYLSQFHGFSSLFRSQIPSISLILLEWNAVFHTRTGKQFVMKGHKRTQELKGLIPRFEADFITYWILPSSFFLFNVPYIIESNPH